MSVREGVHTALHGVELLPLQQLKLALPADIECLVSAGSKGSGKTSGFWLKLGQRIQLLRGAFNGCVCRVSHPALQAPFDDALAWFTRLGMNPVVNRHDMVLKFPSYSGAQLRFMALDDRIGVLARTSGMSLSDLFVDELQAFTSLELPLLMVGLMRTPPGTVSLLMLGFNPGGVLASQLLRAFIEPAEKLPRGTPFFCETVQRRTVVLVSNYRDNRFIDRAAYRRSLVAMSGGNASYLAQIDEGSWRSITGAYYAVTADNFVEWPDFIDWGDYPFLQPKAAADWGSASPYSVSFGLKVVDRGALPCGRVVARGSLIIFSELTSASEESGWMQAGYFASVPDIARAYLHRCASLGLPALKLTLDAACFARHGAASGSLADDFRAAGVHVVPSDKPKLNISFPLMRERVWNARSDGALPAVYFARRQCPYHIASFSMLPAAASNPDVPAESNLLHCQDSARYLLHSASPGAAPQVITQPMHEVMRYSDPRDVALNTTVAAAVADARRRDAVRRRHEFVRGPTGPSDFVSKVLGSKGELRCQPGETKPSLTTAPIVRKS